MQIGDTLKASLIGYYPATVVVSTKDIPTIVLKPSSNTNLEEVVVVGYGQQKKGNLTGAVSNVDFDNDLMSSRPLTNVSSALSGAVSGLNVRQQSGTPGADGSALTLRGATLSGGGPYVVIDGMPGDIGSLSPNDIASITRFEGCCFCSYIWKQSCKWGFTDYNKKRAVWHG